MRFRPTYPIVLAADFGAGSPEATQAGRIALEVADRFIVPAYRSLAEATNTQAGAWAAFAEADGEGGIASLRAAYHDTCDAWAHAQIIRTGPIVLFLRYERFAFWPDARNGTQRALDALMASDDPDDLLPEHLATNAVAGQGLTALERILFDGEGPVAALTASGDEAARRINVGLALARNLNGIANEILTDWIADDGMRNALVSGNGWNNLFADGDEVARLFLTDLVGAFQMMHDVKLLPVLGETIDVARPRLSEAWRSGRAKRDLVGNLEASQAMSDVFAQHVGEARRAVLDESFDAAAMALMTLPDDVGDAAADPERRGQVEAARDAIKATQLLVAEILPADLGITLGFNALDGD
nr:MAG: hypothetical protein E4H34_02050 [Hyphomicrobiales bacterium]